MLRAKSKLWSGAALIVALGLGACSDATSPEPGHFDLVMAPDGTTSGEFFIPAGVSPEPSEQLVSMAGSWTQVGNVVTFEMPGDTYVRFVDWSVSGRELFTEFVNGGFTVTTRLQR